MKAFVLINVRAGKSREVVNKLGQIEVSKVLAFAGGVLTSSRS